MAKERAYLPSLNGGEVSPLSLGRIDLTRMRITAETMINIIPRVIGAMQMRPGLAYTGATLSNSQVKQIPFIFSATDTAMVELSNLAMQVIISNTPLARVSVATQITNGDFSSGTGWTLTVTKNGIATIASGVLTLRTWVRGSTAIAKRSTTVAGGDLNKEHGLRVVVTRGPVILRVGSTDGGDELIGETTLNTGTYSLAFTPTTSPFWVQLSPPDNVERNVVVDSITIEAAGTVTLPAPWLTADLNKCRPAQSGDVIFMANSSRLYQTRRIERRAARSWGIALHENLDGPFRGKTADVKLTLAPQGATYIGDPLLLNSDQPFFKTTHVGCLFRLFSGTSVAVNEIAGGEEWSDSVRVSGRADSERNLNWTVSGTWVGTLGLQVSYDDGLTWVLNTGTKRTVNLNNGSFLLSDPNQVILVRAGFVPPVASNIFGTSLYTSGVARSELSFDGASGWGIVRVIEYVSPTQVKVDVVQRLHGYTEVKEWEEGEFSDLNGWPSSIGLFDGRLWLADNDKLYGSVSDDYDSLDLEVEGDSGPIIRSIATGPVDRALWLLGLGRLCIGTTGAEPIARSTSFDEVMTPDNFSIKDASTYGSADVAAIKVDRIGVFVERSGKRAYILRYNIDDQDYGSGELTKYHPTILATNCIGIAVQRQPDTRVWFTLADGTAACLVYEPGEDVISWWRFETDGDIEDIAVLPSTEGSDVYFIVKRVINGNTVRYRERLAPDTNAWGGTENYMADSYAIADLAAASVVTGLNHLIGKSVVAWINGSPILNGNDPATFVVDGTGQISLGASYTGRAIVGLPYTGQWKSTKLAYGSQMGTAISQPKIIKDFSILLYKTHLRALKYGREFGKLTYMPRESGGKILDANTFLESYDSRPLAFDGAWSTDSRLCIEVRAPMPMIALGLAGAIDTNERG